ncbi:MAG TPA: lipid IV(A) 3-deoxy-D-manno-octulosonic acid transferase [Burkholderiaceae bacterium]|nr:lipid IV(A) 3-deoxy-D-manno-octulosonic acid transferase [Burkholderiaceae bacterium]
MWHALYSAALYAALPFLLARLWWRGRREPAYRRRIGERLGLYPEPVGGASPERALAWVHAVSVGETRAAQPLIEALAAAYPQASFVLTHMTPTGRAVGEGVAQRLPGRVVQRYLPYDLRPSVRRFLAETRPAIGVILETELWPQLLAAARSAGVPMVLANARLSEKSLAKALRYEALVRRAARAFVRVSAQSEADRARIEKLYDGRIDVLGNLKFDLTPSAELVERGVIARAALGNRPVWLFASSREGEERLVLDAFAAAKSAKLGSDPNFSKTAKTGSDPNFLKMGSDPIFLIVPRHPQRFDEVARLIEARGFVCARRSQGALARAAPANAVLLGDSMGEMAMYYAAADVALIGGSLLPFGAQNLIEACAVGTPVVLGPSTYNFAQAAADALAAGAAIQVDNAAQALAAMDALCRDPARREAMRRAALSFAAAHRGATERTVALIEQVLAQRPARAEGEELRARARDRNV